MTKGQMPLPSVPFVSPQETDTRIIIGSFSQELAPQILCEAYRLRMFGADYAWILHESMGAPWWPDQQTACSNHELQLAVENLIVVSTHNSIVGNNVSYSGLVSLGGDTERKYIRYLTP